MFSKLSIAFVAALAVAIEGSILNPAPYPQKGDWYSSIAPSGSGGCCPCSVPNPWGTAPGNPSTYLPVPTGASPSDCTHHPHYPYPHPHPHTSPGFTTSPRPNPTMTTTTSCAPTGSNPYPDFRA